MIGERFEETRVLNLSRAECHERLMAIKGDRLAKGQCFGAYRQPEICAFAACWRGGKRVS
jgi:hypothetical protein